MTHSSGLNQSVWIKIIGVHLKHMGPESASPWYPVVQTVQKEKDAMAFYKHTLFS
jgi:hypothetical protein